MVRSIEEILGVEIERERNIPGTRPGEGEKVRYVGYASCEDPAQTYESVVWKVQPPIAKQGGVMLAGCNIRTPAGDQFYALSYHGDVAGWLAQIEGGAAALGLLSAKIESDCLAISDGRTLPLNECVIDLN